MLVRHKEEGLYINLLVRLEGSGIENEETEECDGLEKVGFTRGICPINTCDGINADIRMSGMKEDLSIARSTARLAPHGELHKRLLLKGSKVLDCQ